VRALIIAAGDGTRWDDYLGLPKHLAPVDGEPIIHRSIRLLRENHVQDVRVVTRDERYLAHGATLEPPVGFEDAGGGIKKFLDSSHLWHPTERTLVVYGDVFFTENAMRTITSFAGSDWTLFCRFGCSSCTGCTHQECFAQSFLPEHHEEHMRALLAVAKWHALGLIKRAGGWEHYYTMCGLKIAGLKRYRHEDPGCRRVVIDDFTDDFDRPRDYQQFLERWKAGEAASAEGQEP